MAQRKESSISRSATPTHTAPMCRRPQSSTFIAVLKPWPSRACPPMSVKRRAYFIL
jgi:hypothetical protein